jgi:hypothetical protein
MPSSSIVTRPSQRPDSIEEILSTLKRYDASVIKDLEDYLQDQHDNHYSDVSANLALLKLYELSEEASILREDATIKALINGLTKFADQDFTLYLHLLPSSTLTAKTEYATKIQNLVSLYELLISNKFDEFVAKNKELGNLVSGDNFKAIEETFNENKNSKFVVSEAVSETVPTSKLSKVIGQLL